MKGTNMVQGNPHKQYQQIFFSSNTAGYKRVARNIYSDERGKIYNQECSTQQGPHSDLTEK